MRTGPKISSRHVAWTPETLRPPTPFPWKAGGGADLAASLAAKLGVPITHVKVEGSHCHMGVGGGFGGGMVQGDGPQLGSLVVAFQVIAGPEMKDRLEAVTEAVASGTPPMLPVAGMKTNVTHISAVQSREMSAGYELDTDEFFDARGHHT